MEQITVKSIEARFTTLAQLLKKYYKLDIKLCSQSEPTKYHFEKTNGSWFPNERTFNSKREVYESMGLMIQMLWLIPDQLYSSLFITENQQKEMQSIYDKDENIFLGDLSLYLPFLSDPKPKKALDSITDEIKDGSYLDNPDYIDNNYKSVD
jgi:hypothetical protein